MKKWSMYLLWAVMMILFLGCQSSDSTETETVDKDPDQPLEPLAETETVVIAEDGSASGAGFYIAKEKGYFEQYNIEVEFATFGNSDEMLPAVASGEVDVAGGISSASFFNSIAQGIDVRFIADKGHNIDGNSYFTFVVREDLKDEITEYEDVKGKKIAVSTKNGVDDYIFDQMLSHAGVSRDEVEFVLMSDFGNMMSAMGNQQIDLALQIEPLITQGENQDIHQRFGDATDYAPEAQIAMVLGSPHFMTERRDVAVRFMAAYLQAIRDYHEAFVKGSGNEEEIISIMADHTAMKDHELWREVGVTGLNPNGMIFEEDVKNQYEFYKERGAIQGELDFEKMIDMSLVEEAIEVIGEYEE
ncbi:sulfonate/nitrate/taurine ABC transporter extracellular binding protein [Gracilibacillus halophilus YIM-C55.5]|uniref:Sulfonate/nitrate/taurine ABC transporter extracellular binding protein n=1 Tax=Gracilibacillus halophilus YIM-C55.5 TaxID=1308866 RepID=N4WC66_9BACI|nr:ABC transporter substrate-binding protein [Gracilibacillus halophilus]ENH97878.1 sulfonate/nitrate/taurine ABC transporter extracellular binding protein [Gracilibacillus halophilus YIM-C55.5]